jgi:hypothetical protein
MKSFEEIIKGHNVMPYEAQVIIVQTLKKLKLLYSIGVQQLIIKAWNIIIPKLLCERSTVT